MNINLESIGTARHGNGNGDGSHDPVPRIRGQAVAVHTDAAGRPLWKGYKALQMSNRRLFPSTAYIYTSQCRSLSAISQCRLRESRAQAEYSS